MTLERAGFSRTGKIRIKAVKDLSIFLDSQYFTVCKIPSARLDLSHAPGGGTMPFERGAHTHSVTLYLGTVSSHVNCTGNCVCSQDQAS